LQVQTNSLGGRLEYQLDGRAGATGGPVEHGDNAIYTANGSVFYRLVYP